MDTSSYLRSQGWLGTGHALNSHKPGLGLEAGQRTPGLSKPLTIPQKQNVFGVGKKKHDSHADQWWARAFDDVLKGVNNNAGAEGQKPTPGGAEVGREQQQQQPPRTNMISMRMGGLGKHGNLYGNFVRGEGLRGTFLKAEVEVVVVVGERDGVANGQVDKGTKRTRHDGVDEDVPAGKRICKEELATSKNQEVGDLPAPKVAVQESSINMTSESTVGSSREQRRRQRQQQEARKAKELADVHHALSIAVKEPIKGNGDLKETKEDRRQRRKAAEAADTQTAFISTGEEPVVSAQEGTETKAQGKQRKQRREERRARKAAETAKPQIALKSLVEKPVTRNERGSETKEEKRQRREERRARKATKKPKVAENQAVVIAMPMEGLENGKPKKVVPDRKSAMTGEPSTVALKREKKARDEREKKKKREQKPLV